MINITRKQLLIGKESLGVLANAKMPIGVAYRINKIVKQANEELQETEKIRREIINKYGKKDENGELIVDENNGTFEIEDRATFDKEIALLFAEVCEFSGEPIDIELLENISMSSQEISAIEPFLKLE
jgi:ribose 5-phosphate isomerase